MHPCVVGASIARYGAAMGAASKGVEGLRGRDAVPGGPQGKEAHVANMYEAYCVKCRAKREFEGSVVELKNGRKAAQGTCPVCGTKVMRILGKSAT